MPCAKVGPLASCLREGDRFRLELCRRDEAIEEAPALAFLRAHGAAGVEKLRRPALADDAGQDRAGAHVAAGEPDAREEEGGLRLRRGEADVGRHGDDRAGADADPVDRRDHRLAAMEHRLHEIAGHAREGEQALHVHRDERADDVVHVAAGGEIAAVRGEDDGLHVVGIGERAEGVAELGVALEGERVLPLRPVERDDRDRALHAPAEVFWLEAGHVGHAMRPSGDLRIAWPVTPSESVRAELQHRIRRPLRGSTSRPPGFMSASIFSRLGLLRPVFFTMRATLSSSIGVAV